MKKIRNIYFYIVIGFIAVAGFLFFPFFTQSHEPPAPNVSANGVEIQTTQGSYCWSGPTSAKCVDKAYRNPLEMAKEHEPTEVASNEEIVVVFDQMPKNETFEVQLWHDETNIEDIKVHQHTFIAPKESGVYVYHITGQWEQGEINYAFSVKVK